MGLRFIYGKAGTGKSTYCFNEIKEHIKNNEKIYIITPEQFSYSAEKRLLEVIDTPASINAEVISFNRMANRVFTEVGGLRDILISKSGRAMIIYSILEKEKKNLKFLGTSNDNIELVLKEITELKKHNINPEKIDDEINKIENIALKEKLEDINNIFKKYENIMKNKFIDEEDVLTKLYQKIPESKMFDNSIVYIDEFAGFTKQEYNILTEILKKAKQVNITLCTDNLEENTEKESDIFYFNKQFKKLLTDCVQIVNKKQEKSIFLNKKYRFKNSELNHLEENIYSKIYKKYEKENKNIKLFLANSPYTEIEHVAQEINKLISNLYEDKISGIISQDTFSSLINKYEEQKQQLEIDIKKHEIYIPNITKYNDLIKELLNFNEINDENISLVFKLINKIIIDDKNISINYKFSLSA